MNDKVAYLIDDIKQYGFLIAYCIYNDITVFRSYYDERDKGKRVYRIDWKEKRLYYSSNGYYENNGFTIYRPVFSFNQYGNVEIVD